MNITSFSHKKNWDVGVMSQLRLRNVSFFKPFKVVHFKSNLRFVFPKFHTNLTIATFKNHSFVLLRY
jgi:hypothetical protein